MGGEWEREERGRNEREEGGECGKRECGGCDKKPCDKTIRLKYIMIRSYVCDCTCDGVSDG